MSGTKPARKPDFANATMGDLRALEDRLMAELARQREQVDALPTVEQVQAGFDSVTQHVDEIVASFRTGTRDFGLTVDSRFSNVHASIRTLHQMLLDRTLRGRWRLLRVMPRRWRWYRRLGDWWYEWQERREDAREERVWRQANPAGADCGVCRGPGHETCTHGVRLCEHCATCDEPVHRVAG